MRQTELIRQARADSGNVHGYRKLTDDLRDRGERISEHRVARLASLAGIAGQVGYRRRPGRYGGQPAVVVENGLEQQFRTTAPDRLWVTDITCIKTHEGWLHLCPRQFHSDQWRSSGSIIDLFARRAVGWPMQSRMTTDLAFQALLMTVWRRKPDGKVTVHTDQGSQSTSREWQSFLCQHDLEPGMSRRGTCMTTSSPKASSSC